MCWWCRAAVKIKRIIYCGELALFYWCRKCNSMEYKKVKEVNNA